MGASICALSASADWLVGAGAILPRDQPMSNMVDVVTSVFIKRPRGEVAAFASDPDNAPRWYVNIKSVEWTTPKPLAVGSRVAFLAQFLGRRLAYEYEIAEFVPGASLVMRTASGPFAMETSYRWEDADGATRMTLRNRGAPAGFSALVVPFMAWAMRRENRNDLSRLKALLEEKRDSLLA